MFEKNLQVATLLDRYGALLNDRHRELLDLYYNQDLSLGEIGTEVGISRQGVRDSIKKAEEDLFFFEKQLRLCEKAEAAEPLCQRLLTLAGGDGALTEGILSLWRLIDPDAGQ